MLANIQQLCPTISRTVVNFYRSESSLFIKGHTIQSKEGTTQGDPLAMPIYALGTLPLIDSMKNENVQQIWYADDAAAGGKIEHLFDYWKKMNNLGPAFGYNPNGSKTWLLVKDKFETKAKEIFKGTNINITIEGRPYLGSPLGTPKYMEQYTEEKIKIWQSEINTLSKFGQTQPQAAYAAFVTGMISEWSFYTRTTHCPAEMLSELENTIRSTFITSITGRSAPNDSDRYIFSLPTRLGGLNIPIAFNLSEHYFKSCRITEIIVNAILHGKIEINNIRETMQKEKYAMKKEKNESLQSGRKEFLDELTIERQKMLERASERGASAWLSALPIAEHGFSLHKGAFRDALCLRYGWRPIDMPSTCVCGKNNNVEHALSCKIGGYPILRHNAMRDTLANAMREVCHDVCVEPGLQPLSGEVFDLKTSSTEQAARLDVSARGFYGGRFERTFFDVRVFNPLVCSNKNSSIESSYLQHESEKRRKYHQRIVDVEHSTFLPFVMACTGGYGPTATTSLKRLATLLADKRSLPYSVVLQWLRTKMSFAMIRSCIMCIRGAKKEQDSYIQSSQTAQLVMAEANSQQ